MPGVEDAYDEARGAGYAETLAALEGCDLQRLRRAVARRLDADGVTFGSEPFVVDPVPRLISADEWDRLEAGLRQRARALNAFLRDVYGERRIVQAGVVSAETIERAEGYVPQLRGRLPTHGWPAAIAGFDVVRAPDGELLVLEDNLRTPSGFAYAVAARRALDEALPPGIPPCRPVEPLAGELLRGALRAAAPPGHGDDPTIVVLSEGSGEPAWYEHAEAGRWLGALVAAPSALVDDGERVGVRLADGTIRAVDVVYRRTDADDVGADEELTGVAQTLLGAWLDGRVGLVNGFGNGVADDKLVHRCVDDAVRFYLDEEPRVRSVPARAIDERPSVEELRELVVKPRAGHGGSGVVIGAHAKTRDLERVARDVEDDPERFVAQPIVALSSHPTVVDGRLAARHVDLRAFAFCGDDVEILPGGLTRVALDAGALVVNSSQHGGGKDTRVLLRRRRAPSRLAR